MKMRLNLSQKTKRKTYLRHTDDEQLDNKMDKTAVTATPSTSLKRGQSVDKNIPNVDYLPKKKRLAAIRAENNLKMLIQNGQVDTSKQKHYPKKVLSLQKEATTETLATLISAGKFDKIEKLYIETVVAAPHETKDNVESSDSEPETLPTHVKNRLEPVTKNVPNQKKSVDVPNTTKKDTPLLLDNRKISKTSISEFVDTNIAEISSTNNLDQNKELETFSDVSRSSLDAEVLALHKLISDLTADNSEKGIENHRTVDIKHIEDIYKTVLEITSKLNAVYQANSIKLRKSFETIQLFVPELKRGLTLPTLQELKAKNQPNEEAPKSLASHQKQPSEVNPSPQPTKPSSPTAESPSQTPELSTSLPECSYVAKWTLKHDGPGPGLTEILPNTGIYIDESEFIRRKLLASDIRHLARLLLSLIFSKEALTKCSYKGYGPKGKRSKSQDTRPGLDEHARNVLLAFVCKHAKESGWAVINPKIIEQSLRDRLRLSNNI